MLPDADKEEAAELFLPSDNSLDYADRIKAYRKKHRITQEELAIMMGVKHFTLRAWEQKNTKPPYHIWRQYKHLFDDAVDLP